MSEGDVITVEEQAVRFHGKLCPQAEIVWVEGINLFLRALDPLNGLKTTDGCQNVLVAFVIGSWNSIYCAHSLALRGYYSQALNLLRTPLENWMGYWYIRSFPEKYVKFTVFQNPDDPSTKAPLFNEMLQAVESKHKRAVDTAIREWIRRLHVFSHVTGAGVLMAITTTDKGLHYHLGPTADAQAFTLCAVEGSSLLVALLEAVDNLRQLVQVGAYPVQRDYRKRVLKWLKSLNNVDSSYPFVE